MVSYIARRKRWVLRLTDLDSNTRVSDNILASCLLACAGLSESEKLMIKTACGSRMNFDEIAATLRRQHPRIQDHDADKSHDRQPERRTFKPWQDREQPKPAGFQPKKLWKPTFMPGFRRSAYLTQGGDEADYDQDGASDACVSVVSTKDYQDVEDQIEQDIVMCFLGVQDGLDDPQFCEDVSGCFHDELSAFYAREQARSNGVNVGKHIHAYKPKSELSVDERREKLNLAKKNSTCRACGKPGH